jgi:hypothetical protein
LIACREFIEQRPAEFWDESLTNMWLDSSACWTKTSADQRRLAFQDSLALALETAESSNFFRQLAGEMAHCRVAELALPNAYDLAGPSVPTKTRHLPPHLLL